MLIPNYYPFIGGAEIFAQEIAERLAKEGNEVDVITGMWDKKQKKCEIINDVNVYRIKVIKSKYQLHYISPFSYILSSLRKVLELNSQKNYDFIHSVSEIGALTGAIFKKIRNKPHLITIQGHLLMDIILQKKIVRKVIEWCLKNSDATHVISKYLREIVEILGAKPIFLIPNGVDDKKFHPMNKEEMREKYGFPQNKKIILTICPGHFRGRKPSSYETGYPNLIEAFAELTKEFPNLQLMFIGEGHKREEFKTLAIKKGIVDKLTFLGFIPHEELPDYLGMADVFIRPSVGEGLGIAFIEAMACGVPVIGTNVGGIPDVIEHGRNGLLVSPYDFRDISNALRMLLEDETIGRRFIEEGLKTVEQKFRWDAIYDEIKKIYGELIKDKT